MIETGNCLGTGRWLTDFECAMRKKNLKIKDLYEWIDRPERVPFEREKKPMKVKFDFDTFMKIPKYNLVGLVVELYDERRSLRLSTKEMLANLKHPKVCKSGRMYKKSLMEERSKATLAEVAPKYCQDHLKRKRKDSTMEDHSPKPPKKKMKVNPSAT